MHEKQRQGGGVSASKKLLAAIAVLAVAFAVFAAIPVAVDDSNAAVVDGDVAKIGDKGYKTLDAAISGASASTVDTIILLKNCTIDTELDLAKSVTFDGTSEKYTITLNKDLHVKGAGITVTFKNLNICNTDSVKEANNSHSPNEILVENGIIVMDTVEFTGVHSVEYGMTLKASEVSGSNVEGKFTNVNFNDKILGNDKNVSKVTLTGCSNVRMNYVPGAAETTIKMSQKADTYDAKIVIDASTAKKTTLNSPQVPRELLSISTTRHSSSRTSPRGSRPLEKHTRT